MHFYRQSLEAILKYSRPTNTLKSLISLQFKSDYYYAVARCGIGKSKTQVTGHCFTDILILYWNNLKSLLILTLSLKIVVV